MTARSDERKSATFRGVEALLSFLETCHALDGHSKRLFKNIYGFSACCDIGSNMTETTDNLVLEHLRAIRTDISALNGNMRDVKARLSSIESYIATLHGDQTRAGLTIDDLAARIERLEKRAGLIEV